MLLAYYNSHAVKSFSVSEQGGARLPSRDAAGAPLLSREVRSVRQNRFAGFQTGFPVQTCGRDVNTTKSPAYRSACQNNHKITTKISNLLKKSVQLNTRTPRQIRLKSSQPRGKNITELIKRALQLVKNVKNIREDLETESNKDVNKQDEKELDGQEAR